MEIHREIHRDPMKIVENHEKLPFLIFFRTEKCRKSSENIARVVRDHFPMFLFFLKMSHFFDFFPHRVTPQYKRLVNFGFFVLNFEIVFYLRSVFINKTSTNSSTTSHKSTWITVFTTSFEAPKTSRAQSLFSAMWMIRTSQGIGSRWWKKN